MAAVALAPLARTNSHTKWQPRPLPSGGRGGEEGAARQDQSLGTDGPRQDYSDAVAAGEESSLTPSYVHLTTVAYVHTVQCNGLQKDGARRLS